MLDFGTAEWGILTVLGFFAAMSVWTIWWHRVRYENTRRPRAARAPLRAASAQGLADAVVARFRFSPSLVNREITVEVHGESAVLRGQVGSEEERELAVVLARSVEGITHVRDELAVPARESA